MKTIKSFLLRFKAGPVAVCIVSFFGFCMGCTVLGSCGSTGGSRQDTAWLAENPGRSIYYWKTVFRITPSDSVFLVTHDINRIYLRLFDVDYDEDWDGEMKAVPIATVKFKSPVPANVEIVPVVYITQDAITFDRNFAPLLYKRIKAMAKGNRFGKVKEIQLDCDWTKGTKDDFFSLCRDLQNLAHADSIAVSATIRLHQLKQEAPPVDRGVLMLYNTGSLYDYDAENSILDFEDVKPYVSPGTSYKLPLALAFPTYGWGLLYRDQKFVSILRMTEPADASYYEETADRRYKVCKAHKLGDKDLRVGDEIRFETSSYSEIMKVKNLLLHNVQNCLDERIIYHLDSLNLSQYSDAELNDLLK